MVHPLIHIYFHKVDLMKVDLFTLRRAADFEMIPQNILHFSFTENHPFMDGHSKIDDQPTRSVVEVSLIQPKGCLCFLTNCTITSKLMKSIVGKAYTSYARKKKKTDVARTFWWAKGGGGEVIGDGHASPRTDAGSTCFLRENGTGFKIEAVHGNAPCILVMVARWQVETPQL